MFDRKQYQREYYAKNKKHIALRTKKWAKKNPDKIKRAWEKWESTHKMNRREKTLRKYNLTISDYFNMYEMQGYLCKICKKTETSKKNVFLVVDHDHKTGKVRGLLCDKCNRGLGHFGDNKELLLEALKYITYHAN